MKALRVSARQGVQAVEEAFARAGREGRTALITYLTMGYPTREAALELVPALESGGADIIELGVPFSDPVADGPAIQRASYCALQAGMTPALCLEQVARLREMGLRAPLLLMGYYNPIHHYGQQEYVRDCRLAGADGLIVPDLPPEEAGELMDACRRGGVALVFLVAPTTSEGRVREIAGRSTGFLYVVSRLGTTGADKRFDTSELRQRLEMVRRLSPVPVAVGFGISSAEQARALVGLADGVIVGSAVVERAIQGPAALRAYTAQLREALYGTSMPAGA
ncbi:MAG: tryptophan synthase subunit alpha [Anaerolineae bacterium]